MRAYEVLSAWLIETPAVPVRRFSKGKRRRRSRLGGRLNKKSSMEKTTTSDWSSAAFEKLVFVYMRFSTREQREKNTYSYERQEHLRELAIQHGARAALSPEEIATSKTAVDYPGWYRDGQIVVELAFRTLL